MKLKLDGLQHEEARLRMKNAKAATLIKSFHHDFHQLTQLIQEPRALKDAVKALNDKYRTDKVKNIPIDKDLLKEMTRQRDYLERNVEGLQRKLSKDTAANHKSRLLIMQENVVLIKELNELRRELKIMKLNAHKGPQPKSEEVTAMAKDIESMHTEFQELHSQLERKKKQIEELENTLEKSDARGSLHSKDGTTRTAADGLPEDSDLETLRWQLDKLHAQLTLKQQSIESLEKLLHDRKSQENGLVEISIVVKDGATQDAGTVENLQVESSSPIVEEAKIEELEAATKGQGRTTAKGDEDGRISVDGGKAMGEKLVGKVESRDEVDLEKQGKKDEVEVAATTQKGGAV